MWLQADAWDLPLQHFNACRDKSPLQMITKKVIDFKTSYRFNFGVRGIDARHESWKGMGF
jgi:hypothetical protein